MFSSIPKTRHCTSLLGVVCAGMIVTACQTYDESLSSNSDVRSDTINFRSDLYYAVNPEVGGEAYREPPSFAVSERRVVIPIRRVGQKRLDNLDDYLLPLIITTSHWFDVREVKVAGHTDSEGSELSNMLLSLRRAGVVADRLEALGVEAALLRIEAYGESRPIGDNTSMAGRVANRRVEVVVTGYLNGPAQGAPLLATYEGSGSL